MTMNQLQAAERLDDLLQQDVSEVRSWLHAVRTGSHERPLDFNWLGLAEGASFNARYLVFTRQDMESTSPTPELEALSTVYHLSKVSLPTFVRPDMESVQVRSARNWAEVAVAVYELLIGGSSSARRDSFSYSLMNFRAYMILKLDVVPRDPVLDVDQIIYWFFDNLRVSFQDVYDVYGKVREEEMHSINVDTARGLRRFRELRRIKDRLGILAMLVDGDRLQPSTGLRAWLSIREQLP
jgi:hypothetical protein